MVAIYCTNVGTSSRSQSFTFAVNVPNRGKRSQTSANVSRPPTVTTPNDNENQKNIRGSTLFSPHLGSNVESHSEFFNNSNENSPLHSIDNICASECEEIATLDENQENCKGSLN
ncbi:hypothetical protein Tco_0610583 [Tanacetum coccineum]